MQDDISYPDLTALHDPITNSRPSARDTKSIGKGVRETWSKGVAALCAW